MDYMRLKKTDLAQEHLLAAWKIARQDDLVEGFGEHHGLMGAMLEAVIKPRWPDDFKRIIDITNHFSKGWRDIHNPDTGQQVADNLTTTEFAVAMLVAQDWTAEDDRRPHGGICLHRTAAPRPSPPQCCRRVPETEL